MMCSQTAQGLLCKSERSGSSCCSSSNISNRSSENNMNGEDIAKEEDIVKVVTPMRSARGLMRRNNSAPMANKTSSTSSNNRRRFSRSNSNRSNRSSTTSTKSNSSDGQRDICYNCEAPISSSSSSQKEVPNNLSSTSLSPFTSSTNMTSFDCEYCERTLCGTCITNVPCSGPNCTLSNCIECAENGNGDVLYCTHCGKGYCNDCKSMEYCYCLQSDTCPECHVEMHDYDVETYWRHLPPEFQKLLTSYKCRKTIDVASLAEYWNECVVNLLPNDDEFDLRLYRRNRKARAASLILAAYYLLKNKEKESVYLILYAALLEEVWNRGANYLKELVSSEEEDEDYSDSNSNVAKMLSVHFTSFHAVVENTVTKSGMVALLHNQRPSIREKEGRKLFECITYALGQLQKKDKTCTVRIHRGNISHNTVTTPPESLSMNIIASSKDNETKQKNFVYKDMSLSWWLKVYVIKCMYHKWLTSPVTPSTEYYRIVHQGKTIFLSSAGNKTLQQLGICDGDEIVVEGIVANQIPMEHESSDDVELCQVCDTLRPTITFDMCMGCEKNACGGCSPNFFDCEYCERLLCGVCVPEVVCEGTGCDLTNCIECAENGDGDVLFCTNCGEGYCTDCKPMEFCFCLVGDTCPECHSAMHEDDIEYNWQHLPDGMQAFIADCSSDYPSLRPTPDEFAAFWCESIRFLPQDKDFDVRNHRKTRQARGSSLILASYHLLMGQDSVAVYLVAYAALLNEVWNRGPNYIRRTFEDDDKFSTGGIDYLAAYCTSFRSLLEHTKTKTSIIAFLHSQVQGVTGHEGKELFKCMDSGLSRLPKSDMPFARGMPNVTAEEVAQMSIITANMDIGEKDKRVVCKDITLGWLIRSYQIQRSYDDWLANPEMPPSEPTKFFRVVHQGKTLFISSAGKKTLHQLGISSGDEIIVGGVEVETDESDQETSKAKKKKNSKKTTKKHKTPSSPSGKKKKKQPKSPPVVVTLTQEQLEQKWRLEHSKSMTPVFEEIAPCLKDIRNRLNDMMLKKSKPKVRILRRKSLKLEASANSTLPPSDGSGLGGKAGKHVYSVLVGDESNLYKTSKVLSRRTAVTVIDLHGYTKDEALEKLEECLPTWINTAMREDPFVIPVDIICGGGSQILAEVVEMWIRYNRQVANRPKGR